MRRIIPALVLGAALALANTATATPIGPGAFGAGQVFESFEGHSVGPNMGSVSLSSALLEPGIVSAFSFASGVVLSDPVPNPGTLSGGAFLHDFSLGSITNNWGGSRRVNDAGDVPFGSAYLGIFDSGGGTAAVEFSFAQDMDRVGAYVSGVRNSTVTLEVYDASDTLLETLSIGTVSLPNWPNNFLGIEDLTGIRRAVFSGADFGVDGLTFEASAPLAVPEAGTLPALAAGLTGLWGLAAYGRRREEVVA